MEIAGAMDYSGTTLSWRHHDDAVEVELHRAPLNEIGMATLEELERLAAYVQSGASGARALIFWSSRPGFCAGADLKEIAAGRGRELITRRGGFAGLTRRERTKPLIAAIAGSTLAGGTEIAIRDVQKRLDDMHIHLGEVTRGSIAVGDVVDPDNTMEVPADAPGACTPPICDYDALGRTQRGRARLEAAKDELRDLFGRPRRADRPRRRSGARGARSRSRSRS